MKNDLRTLAIKLYSVVLAFSILLLSIFLYMKASLWVAVIGLFTASIIGASSTAYFIRNKYPSEIYLSNYGVQFHYKGRDANTQFRWEDIKKIYIGGNSDAFSSRSVFLKDGSVINLNFVSLGAAHEIAKGYERYKTEQPPTEQNKASEEKT